jgi:gamma-glutamylcyclotransferase (GGCT)/AIG2-like uncharacterized protein YtfP
MGDDNAMFNIFVYGSLRDSLVFQSVCGFRFTRKPSRQDENTLFAEPAFLPGHKKVSPDNVYFYAVEAPNARIEGLVIYNVPAPTLTEIDRYEGRYYERETVHVNTAVGLVKAQAYLASHESMKKNFGDRFHVNLIHELWLRKRIGRFISKRTRPGERTQDAQMERLADRELLGTTERDLVMSHYRDTISDYFLQNELNKPRPSIKHLRDDPAAQRFVSHYLRLVVKQVLVNQLDEKVQATYRFRLEHMRTSERYFKRSFSVLVALQMINANEGAVDWIVNECLKTMPFAEHDLIDYAKYAVRAARSLFDPRIANAHLEKIQANFQPGLIPLGCEIELSNLGFAAIASQDNQHDQPFDPIYDGFRYFYDFGLDLLAWKLGGYIDNHRGSTDRGPTRGFLELAPGRLNIAGELSRPATADPWLLNQLIQQITEFYDIRPHSLHLSFQLRRDQIGRQKVLPLEFVKCLLVLGGGAERRTSGNLWFTRMAHNEITELGRGEEELMFARTSKRNWYLGSNDIAHWPPSQATTYVQQYKFIRLEGRANYEPLILCLKGLQLEYNPGDYLTMEQLRDNPKLRQDYTRLKKWVVAPTKISPQAISRFLKAMHRGLTNEGLRRPVHKLHYIDWAVGAIDTQLRMFNQQLEGAPHRAKSQTKTG